MSKRIRLEVAAPGPVNTAGQENYYTETEVDDDDAKELDKRDDIQVVSGRKPSGETLLEGADKATVIRHSDEPNSDRQEADNPREAEGKKARKASDRKESERGSRTAETTSRRAQERR